MNSLWQTQLRIDEPGFWIVLALVAWAVGLAANRRLSPAAQRLVAVARWLLIPYAALLTGAVSPRLMGLTQIDWRVTIGFGLTIVVALIAAVGLVALHQSADAAPPQSRQSARGVLPLLGLGALQEFYWCFLRGAVVELLLMAAVDLIQIEYWAGWLVALLVLPDLPTGAGSAVRRLSHVTALVITTVLFIYTRNYWLCAVAHGAILLIFRLALPAPATDRPHAL